MFLHERPFLYGVDMGRERRSVESFYRNGRLKFQSGVKRIPSDSYWDYKWSLSKGTHYPLEEGEGCMCRDKFMVPNG